MGVSNPVASDEVLHCGIIFLLLMPDRTSSVPGSDPPDRLSIHLPSKRHHPPVHLQVTSLQTSAILHRRCEWPGAEKLRRVGVGA